MLSGWGEFCDYERIGFTARQQAFARRIKGAEMSVKNKQGSAAIKPNDFQINISPIKKATPYQTAIDSGHRKHLRITHNVRADMHFKGGISLSGQTQDISAEGLFVRLPTTPAHMAPGTIGTITMHPKLGKALKFHCEVVRTMNKGIALLLTDHDRHEMGMTLLYDILGNLNHAKKVIP